MINEIGFGLIDNGILVGGAIIGFSIEDLINRGLEYLLRKKNYKLVTRVKGLSGALLGAGIGNAISDFAGGWCISWVMAFGTFIGCMLIVILSLPIIFKIESKNKKRVCRNCGVEIKTAMYETGAEEYCNCQNTIMADFNEKLWE